MTHLIWDYDYSLISCNSDEAIPLHFSPAYISTIKEGSRQGIQWTNLMAKVAKEMHSKGVTKQQLIEAAGGVSVDKYTLSLIKSLPPTTIQYILSDANEVYIQSFLSAHGLSPVFDGRVVTNPAHFSEDGCLIIEPQTPPTTPHNCPRCPVNLCKGVVFAREGFPLAQKCAANPPQAKVVLWSSWKDLSEKIISHCT